MLSSLLIPLLLPAASALLEGPTCQEVTSSECNPAPNTGFHLNSQTDCMGMCDAYASSGLGCRFAAWVESASDNCLLYSLEFSTFLSGCRVLGGPPTSTSTTPSGCDVEYPDDNTCDVIRDGDCFYYGDELETPVDNVDNWLWCSTLCSRSPDCEAWTFRSKPIFECRLLASDNRTCQISYFPSMVDPDDCNQATTTTLATTTTTASTTTTTTAMPEPGACLQVTSSECEPAANTGLHVAAEADCQALCDTYDNTGVGCSFVAWAEAASINCHIYTLPFYLFLSGCKKLGGPPDLTGCDVEHPEDNTCEVVRDGDCRYYGGLLESVDNLDSWEGCENYCTLNPDCEAWTFRTEPSLECRLMATEDRTCDISYTPSRLNPDDCTSTGTGLLIAGGWEAQNSAEVWSPGNTCKLPNLPSTMSDSPSVDVVAGLPVACHDSTCYQLTLHYNWQYYQDTLFSRTRHTSAVLEKSLILVGGYVSPSTSEVLLGSGEEAQEGFPLNPGRDRHCSMQVNPTTIILSGGTSSYSMVTEYSNLNTAGVTNSQLPDHLTGRRDHACSWLMVGTSQVLIVTGGWSGSERLISTELLDYQPLAKVWREAGQLPSARTGLKAAKLGAVVHVTGGFDGTHSVRDILAWSPDSESWYNAGLMNMRNYDHSVTEVSLAAVKDYCGVLH